MKKLLILITLILIAQFGFGQIIIKQSNKVNNLNTCWFGSGGTAATDTANAVMVVKRLGNVGIGTASPAAMLDVIGNVSAEYTNDTIQHRIIATSAADNNISTQVIIDPTSFQFSADDYTNGTYAQISGSSLNNSVVMQGGDGNVGIGTYTPTAKLSVVGDVIAIVTSDTLEHTFTAISSADNNISSYIYVNSFATALVSNNLTDTTNSSIEVSSSAGITITSNTLPTIIQPTGNSGNVGIGTASPTQKLDVNGSVKIDSSLIMAGIYFTDIDSTFTIPSGLSTALSWKAGAGQWVSGTVTLPANPANGQLVAVSGNWLTVSLAASGGASVAFTPTAAQFRHGTKFIYRAADTTWYPN